MDVKAPGVEKGRSTFIPVSLKVIICIMFGAEY